MAETMVAALSELSIDARIGEVSGEYCPGEFSVNARGESKLAGIGQRVFTGGAHVGGVVVVRGAGRIRTVLEPIYEALELDWRPATTGSIALEIGDDDETIPSDRTDPLIERTMAALRTTLSRTYVLDDATLDEAILALAKELADTYRPRLNRDP
jgi:lipoate-protein ligase A